MRFWLWLTTGMVTRQWVAIHRRHHQKSDQAGDPHIVRTDLRHQKSVLFGGAFLYHSRPAKIKKWLHQLSHGTPNDWVERNVYAAHSQEWALLNHCS
jgi:stearoyl-CoA desaturase (Delta-9 desaturase)